MYLYIWKCVYLYVFLHRRITGWKIHNMQLTLATSGERLLWIITIAVYIHTCIICSILYIFMCACVCREREKEAGLVRFAYEVDFWRFLSGRRVWHVSSDRVLSEGVCVSVCVCVARGWCQVKLSHPQLSSNSLTAREKYLLYLNHFTIFSAKHSYAV